MRFKGMFISAAGLVAMMALGASSASAATFSNSSPITIPENFTATPYPSQIAVSGLKDPIEDLNVRVNGVSHSNLQDAGFLLGAPDGRALLVMDCVGGDNAGAATNVSFTIDDSASGFIPGTGVPIGGTYKPTDNCPSGFTGVYPAPGPGQNYARPGPVAGRTGTLASSFKGMIANGTWNLYVVDFNAPNSGQVAGGWALDITTQSKKCKKKKQKKKGKGSDASAAKKKKCKKKKKK